MAWALGSRYLVGERLGSGGMGAVYRAARRDGGPDRAVKLLRPELADNPVILARFVQERVLMLALRSPHLVVVEDLIVDGDVVAIVMELVSGGTLRQHMTVNGPLSEGEAFEAIRQVLLGLGVVHGHGVVHRDVKPENVLIGTNPETGGLTIKVSDFGIARLLDGPHLTGTFEYIGTVHYSAPEIAQGLPPTPATDVYAVGVMLYELLSGATPFAGGAPIAVMKRQLEQPPPRPPMIGDSAWALILRWLDAEPGARPADAWEALREINELQTASDGASAAAPLPGAELKLGPTAAPSSFVIPGQAAPIASSPGAGAFSPVGPALAADAAAADHLQIIHERSPQPPELWPPTALTPPPGQSRDSNHPSIVPGFEGAATPDWPSEGRTYADPPEEADPAPDLRRKRGLILAGIGILVAGLIGGAAILLTGGSSSPKHYAFVFPVESFPSSGVTVARTWSVTGGKHPELHGVLDFTTSRPTSTQIEEVLPDAPVSDRSLFTFHPQPDVVETGRVVRYTITAGTGQTIQATYAVPVPAADVSSTALQHLADEQLAETGARYRLTHRLVSLAFSTKAVGVSVGDLVKPQLSGTQLGNSRAPTVALFGVQYTVDDPHTATVNADGAIKGVAPGITTVHAALGSLTTKIVVFVTASTAAPQLNPSPGSLATPGPGSSAAPPSAASSPSANATPLPTASAGPSLGSGPSGALSPSGGPQPAPPPASPIPTASPPAVAPVTDVPTAGPTAPPSIPVTPPPANPPANNLAPSAAADVAP